MFFEEFQLVQRTFTWWRRFFARAPPLIVLSDETVARFQLTV